MSITVGTGASTKGASSASLSVPITCSGSDRLLLAGAVSSAVTPVKPSGATYNSVAMTEGGTVVSGNIRLTWYYLLAPDTGTHNLVVSYGTTNDENFISGIPLSGVDQTTPVNNFTPAVGNDATIQVILSSTSAGNIIVDISGHIRTDETIGADQTLITHDEDVGGYTCINSSYETGAGPKTMTWTFGGASDWVTTALEIKEAVSSTGPSAAILKTPRTIPHPPREHIISMDTGDTSVNWEAWFSFLAQKVSELLLSDTKVTEQSADYTLKTSDFIVYVTTGAAPVDITLPLAQDTTNKAFYIFKVDAGAGSVVILPSGADTINGTSSKTVTLQWNGVLIRKVSHTSWIASSIVRL